MLHVTILMVGKTREAFIQEGVAFYQKRLQPFLHLTLKSVREEKEAAGLNAAAVKVREGERLQAQIPPRAFAIALTPQGRQFSSEEFAAWLTALHLARGTLAQTRKILAGGRSGCRAIRCQAGRSPG